MSNLEFDNPSDYIERAQSLSVVLQSEAEKALAIETAELDKAEQHGKWHILESIYSDLEKAKKLLDK